MCLEFEATPQAIEISEFFLSTHNREFDTSTEIHKKRKKKKGVLTFPHNNSDTANFPQIGVGRRMPAEETAQQNEGGNQGQID